MGSDFLTNSLFMAFTAIVGMLLQDGPQSSLRKDGKCLPATIPPGSLSCCLALCQIQSPFIKHRKSIANCTCLIATLQLLKFEATDSVATLEATLTSGLQSSLGGPPTSTLSCLDISLQVIPRICYPSDTYCHSVQIGDLVYHATLIR